MRGKDGKQNYKKNKYTTSSDNKNRQIMDWRRITWNTYERYNKTNRVTVCTEEEKTNNSQKQKTNNHTQQPTHKHQQPQ